MGLRQTFESLRAHALALPGAFEDHPWGESVAKVKGKIFVFFGREPDPGEPLRFSVKLPESGERLLDRDCAEPTGYGLGKSGWVTVSLTPGDAPDIAELRAWIEESYRAVAPKTLLREGAGGSSPRSARAPAGKARQRPARKARDPRRRG
jgi:predicted DNA-binding protein (MmcQ/YjbR family)